MDWLNDSRLVIACENEPTVIGELLNGSTEGWLDALGVAIVKLIQNHYLLAIPLKRDCAGKLTNLGPQSIDITIL
jgi:hypothetical protein